VNRRTTSERAAIASAALLAMTALGSQSSRPKQTIRVSTHLVQITVSVRDRNGPVLDLTKDDFVILDRGKPQKISVFEAEATEIKTAAKPRLPPDAFSNLPLYEDRPRSITIVLLDNLNTLYGSAPQPFETSPYWMEDLALANAKFHLIDFIRTLDPRDRVAVYGLSGSLHVLCDFTSDRSQLLRVLKNYETNSVTNREIVEPGAIHTPGPGSGSDDATNASALVLAGMANARRAGTTMAALQSIAAHVANMPGRKNLVWLTANLPFSAAAMANILAPAQIAVYPVDGRGLLPRMSLQSMEGVLDEDAVARGDFAPAQAPEPIGIETMVELADDTGGQASVNTNALADAIRDAVGNSAATYKLGFYVDKDSLDGKFHELKLQIRRPGLNLRYPRGYFAAEDSSGLQKERGSAVAMAIHSPFEWSALPLQVRLARVEKPRPHSVEIVGAVDLKNLQMTQEGNLWTGALTVYVVEQDVAGKVLTQIPDGLRLRLSEQQYQDYRVSGIVFRQFIQPKPDSTTLRVLVQDPASANVGSVIIPLAQVK
jgi:VWFA-related protein